MKTPWSIGPVLACSLALLPSPADAAGPATAPAAAATQPDRNADRLTFLTLRLSSAEESIKAINAALRVAGYKVAVATDKAQAAEKGNELMDRKGGAPVPWDQFYGKTAKAFIAPTPPGLYAVKVKGTGDVTYPWNDPLRRPKQFDYLYRANNEQAAKAKEQVAALGRKVDALLARRRQLEAEQVVLWTTVALESIGNREIATRPLYRFALKSDGAKPSDQARVEIVRAAVQFIRLTDRAAAKSVDTVADDQGAALKLLRANVQSAEENFRESVLRPTQAADLNAEQSQQLKDLLALAKRMQLLCKNVTEGYALALESDAANDEPRKQAMRAQLQDALIGFADAAGDLDDAVTRLATAWGVKAEPGVDSPDKLPPLSPAAAGTSKGGPAAAMASEATPLFDGKSLAGWEGDGRAWSVADDAIRGKLQANKPDALLVTTGSFANFVLDADFKLVSGNTGIYFRADQSRNGGGGPLRGAFEADIFHPNAIGKLSFDEAVVARPDAELQKKTFKPGEWNHYTVEATGDHVRLWVNGTLMTDVTHRGAAASGRIALQLHGPTEAYFRDLRVRELP